MFVSVDVAVSVTKVLIVAMELATVGFLYTLVEQYHISNW
jgi:hypothetical protein